VTATRSELRQSVQMMASALGLNGAAARCLLVLLVLASSPEFCFTFAPTSLFKFPQAFPTLARYPARTRPAHCVPLMTSQENTLAEEEQKTEGNKKKNLQTASLDEVKRVMDQVLQVGARFQDSPVGLIRIV
jgi:hypothetical protein